MSTLLIVILIFAPALFWIGYFYYYDRYRPEPFVLTAFAFLLGFTCAWLCLKASDLLPLLGLPVDPESLRGTPLKFLGYCLGVVGLFEELCKLLPFLLILFFRDFDERIDGIFYASTIALGFAAFENTIYLPTLSSWAALGRGFASPLTHTIFASIWGYWVGLARIHRKPLLPAILKGLLLASLAHGLFDFLTLAPLLRALSSLLILFIWLWRIRASESLVRQDKEQPPALDRMDKRHDHGPGV